jgi:glucokinase
VTGLVAGLDVGGTKTSGVAVDGSGAVVAEVHLPTATGSGTRLVASTADALRRLADRAGGRFTRVGVGVPGVVDREAGTVRHAVNLGLDGRAVDLAGALAGVAGAPVVVENDVNAAALGASILGLGDDLAYLSVGTGVAAGFVLGGRLRRGFAGVAGEIGHLVVDPAGPPCSCGQRGCLEAFASGSAVARRWPSTNGSPAVAALVAAAAGGDPAGVAALDGLAWHLAAAVTLVCLTVDPAVAVLGGGVAEAGPSLAAAVGAALRRRATGSPLLTELDLAARVTVLGPERAAGAVGAARLAAGTVVA